MLSVANTTYAAFVIAPASTTTQQYQLPPARDDKAPKALHTQKAPARKTGWPGIVSFAAGVLTVVAFLLTPFIFMLLLAPAVIFGIIGSNKKKHTQVGFAYAGLAVGILALLVFIMFILA